MRIFMFSVLVGMSIVSFFPAITEAAPLVPCDGPDCGTCEFIELGDNLLEFLITMMTVLGALVIAFAGFKMVTSGGDAGAVSEARGMITNVVIGFIIMLSAWLVVDTVMKAFVKDDVAGFGPWNDIECATQAEVGTPPTDEGTVTVVPGSTCTGQCATIPSGIQVKSGACSGSSGCTVSSEIVNQLTTLDSSLDAAGVNWRITEAYPPTRNHLNACHQSGTCIDANCINGCSNNDVKTFIQAASNAGLRAVYEVSTQAQKDALVSSGVSANNIEVLGSWISGSHFSVYKQ